MNDTVSFDLETLVIPDFAQTRTLDEALQATIAAVGRICQAKVLEIMWAGGEQRLLFTATPAHPLARPDATQQSQLARSAIVTLTPTHTLVPLHARGELCGWLALNIAPPAAEHTHALLALAGQLGPALALHIAVSEQHERVRHLQTLTEVGRTLGQTLNLDSLFDAIYAAAARVVDVADFYLAFYDAVADELDLAYVRLDGERVVRQSRWKTSEGLAGVVLRQRTPLYTEDYVRECAHQGVAPRRLRDMPPRQSWLGVPLIANDVPIGIMNVSSMHVNQPYSREQIALLTAIGAQAAIALANAQLYRQSERQAQQLAALNHIGRTITSSLDPDRVPSLIMDQVCTLLNVSEGSLLLVDDASNELMFAYANGPIGTQLLGKRIPRNQGIAGYVMHTGQSIIANDVQGDQRFSDATDRSTGFITKTLLAVPLRGVGGTQGVIEVLNRCDNQPFTQEDRHLLEAIADQAVTALKNAQRFAQVDQALARRVQELASTNAMLQHNLQSLTALNALSMAITTSLRNPRDIFTMTARGITEASNARGALVLAASTHQFQPVVSVGSYDPYPLLDALCIGVMHSGRPELICYDQAARKSILAVPLRAPQRLIGVICVFYTEVTPSSSEQETIMLFATQAAAAVESLDLFATIRSARDEMASILASTHEGMLLLAPDGSILHANSALDQLTQVPHTNDAETLESWLAAWEQQANYAAEEWTALRSGIAAVLAGGERYLAGQLQAISGLARALEWAVLPVDTAHRADGALLVLRDITAAREAARMRHDLTNMIVHDLRSPLSSIMAAIDMLVRGISGDLNSGQHHILGIAYASSQQMLEMINTLLDISRLEVGSMPLNIRVCAIEAVIERASERLATLAQDRSIVIAHEFPTVLPQVAIDYDQIVRVVQNLLANAVTFSHPGSTVLVRTAVIHSDEGPMLQVAVIDRGIGIAPNDLERVFTKFSQVGKSRGGTGLGLTFCKLTIEAHAGRIWLESTLGIGSSFFFTVPLAAESDW